MYFWNYHALAQEFKEHKVTSREKLKYLLCYMIYIPTGLMGSNWIPGMYRLIYRVVNEILSFTAPKVPPLKIFNDFNYITDIATMTLIGIGIFYCYLINYTGDGRSFVDRFMCLTVPITIRISTYVLIIFLGVLGFSVIFFNYKLQLISNIHGFFRVFKKLRHLNALTEVMAYVSHRMHVFSCFMAIVSLMWSFITLARQIRFISRP